MIKITRLFLYYFLIFTTLVLIIPACIFRPFNQRNTYLFLRIFRILCRYIIFIQVHVENKNIIDNNSPSVIICNHQHNLDVLMATAVYTNKIVILGKHELVFVPLFGLIYVLCGNILVKRGNKKKALNSMSKLETAIYKKGLSVFVFPEGHRNINKTLLRFKKGAFYTAVNTQIPVIPFSVSQYVINEDLNSFKKINIHIKVHSPISTKGMTTKDIPELIQKSEQVIVSGIEELNKRYS